jgi:hypothetical protein
MAGNTLGVDERQSNNIDALHHCLHADQHLSKERRVAIKKMIGQAL